jgi:hypothetical protein
MVFETLSYCDNKRNVITFCRVWLGSSTKTLQSCTLVLQVDMFCHMAYLLYLTSTVKHFEVSLFILIYVSLKINSLLIIVA